jgi:YVTN family beta-propeller protein
MARRSKRHVAFVAALLAGSSLAAVEMAQAQSGPLLYVPNSSGAFDVSVVDTPTNTLVATIPLGAGLPPPTTAAVRGDEALAYVTGGPNGVAVINTGTNTVVTTITAGNSPAGVAVSPDATRPM